MSDISVKGAVPVQQITSQPDGVTQSGPTAGVSSAVAAGYVPDAVVQSYEGITQSLSKFFPALTGDKIDILIAEASLKLKEIVGKTETQELNAKEEQKRQNAIEQRAKAEDSQKKLDEAQEAAAKAKKSGLFGKIFGGIALALSVVAAGLLLASGVGAPLAAVIVVGVVASVALYADGYVAEANGTGIFGTIATSIMEARGFSDEAIEEHSAKWDKIGRGVMIALMVVSVVVTFGATAASSAGSAASTGVNSATTATTGASTATTVGGVSIGSAQSAVTILQAGTTIGASTATMITAKRAFDAANFQADAQDAQAQLTEMQALNQLLDDFIDQILARVSATNSQFNAMLDDVVTSIKDRGDTLARAKFAG